MDAGLLTDPHYAQRALWLAEARDRVQADMAVYRRSRSVGGLGEIPSSSSRMSVKGYERGESDQY